MVVFFLRVSFRLKIRTRISEDLSPGDLISIPDGGRLKKGTIQLFVKEAIYLDYDECLKLLLVMKNGLLYLWSSSLDGRSSSLDLEDVISEADIFCSTQVALLCFVKEVSDPPFLDTRDIWAEIDTRFLISQFHVSNYYIVWKKSMWKKLLNTFDPVLVAQTVCGIYKVIDFTALLAARTVVSNLHKNAKKSFLRQC
ncbi:hypothetical protein MKW98_016945 [Papaver atlanticum]|uniref:Uncharacterized protein n=1 Tax=Papaver atlanticum TaxID=357466 RepID=A0AAD4TKF8_9MAGN|nr:hypothetical protein MKW98_016945 [Papaver atlanticum]